MKVLRALNNNVVLAADRGAEVILTGWGVGFGARPGDEIAQAKVQRVFVPEDSRDTDHLSELLAAVPLDYITLADELVGDDAGVAAIVALGDHLHVAVERARQGTELGEHVLAGEVAHLYPSEYAKARRIIAAVNAWLKDREPGLFLPDSESIAVTLHLVNAAFMTGDLAPTYLMTGLFSQLFEVIEAAFGRRIDRDSLSAARFITHLRYFFVRAQQGEQLNDRSSEVLMRGLESEFPESLATARRLAAVLELRLSTPITTAEVAYVALHVARLMEDETPAQRE